MANDKTGQGIKLAAISIGVGMFALSLSSIFSDFSGAQPLPAPPDAMLQALPPAAGTPAPSGEQLATPDEKAEGELRNLVQAWSKAWSEQDTATYLAFYAPGYAGNSNSPEEWRAARKRIIGQARFIDLKIGETAIELDSNDRATLSFALDYTSDRLEDHGTKTLQVRRNNGRWLIENETFAAN